MIIHSVAPIERLTEKRPVADCRCVGCGSGYIEAAADSSGRMTVRRLCSTDPADYLDPANAPGSAYRPAKAHKNITRFY